MMSAECSHSGLKAKLLEGTSTAAALGWKDYKYFHISNL